jgi:hypothetical protein
MLETTTITQVLALSDSPAQNTCSRDVTKFSIQQRLALRSHDEIESIVHCLQKSSRRSTLPLFNILANSGQLDATIYKIRSMISNDSISFVSACFDDHVKCCTSKHRPCDFFIRAAYL